MPQQGYSIGRDVTLNINTGQGILQVRGITGFTSRQEDTKVKLKLLDGHIKTLRFFEGWAGRFDLERRNGMIDRHFNRLEANYYAGITESEVTIMQTVVESDGTTTRLLYREVLLSLEEAGNYQGDTSVKQGIAFVASRRHDG
jgi:hypothetical protein